MDQNENFEKDRTHSTHLKRSEKPSAPRMPLRAKGAGETKSLSNSLSKLTSGAKSAPTCEAVVARRIPVGRAERTYWAMNDSLRPAYMVTLVSEIDATDLEKAKGASSYTALVMRAAALTMREFPEANRAILGLPFMKQLYQFQNVDISVAVEKSLPALPGAAFASPITGTLAKTALEITQELRALRDCTEDTNPRYRALIRILKYIPRPLSLWLINAPLWFPKLWVRHRGCACWVNAPSKAGVDLVTTSWPWPITFSFGVVKQRPLVVDGELKARLTMPVVMVFDRRVMGGGPAGRIFARFKEILEKAIAADGPEEGQ